MAIELIQNASTVIMAPKRVLTVSGATFLTGIAEYLKVMPWGKVAAIVGIISTLIMASIHVVRLCIDLKKEKDNVKMRRLEREIKHLEIEALKAEAEERHNGGDD